MEALGATDIRGTRADKVWVKGAASVMPELPVTPDVPLLSDRSLERALHF